MKKIGIFTINDYTNYGNRLQNYAVQEVLESLGTKTVTIVNTTKTNKVTIEYSNRMQRLMKLLVNRDFQQFKKKYYLRVYGSRIREAQENKIINFKSFTDQHIKETDYSINIDNIPEDLNNNYDYFVTGSDQVWNPSFRHFSEIDFLTFAPQNKRIAYSPSFGISSIPEEYKEDFKRWINEMSFLSVREDAGARIIKELTGRESTVLLDPTMMLDKDKWFDISKKDKFKPNVPYLCTYFLGETFEAHKASVYKIAKSNNLEVVNLGSVYDLKRYSIDPSEFLDYIASSELFLTDSFHGAIFSIIFEKPFIVFDRLGKLPSMNSRIDTLLTKFSLINRKWESVKQSQDYFGADFSHTGPIFEYERSKAYSYLKNALNIEDAN